MSDLFQRRPAVASTIRDLVRWIHANGYAKGDKLPTQEEFRTILGCHNHSLSKAMETLVECGLIARSRGLGTTVVDVDAVPRNLWRIGLALFPLALTSPYHGQLLHLIQSYLVAAGTDISIYVRRFDVDRDHLRFSDFHHLDEDIRQRRIDALLTMSSLHEEDWDQQRRRGVPICHVGNWEDAPFGVLIDEDQIVTAGLNHLFRRGVRFPAIVTCYPPKPGNRRFLEAFSRECRKHDLSPRKKSHFFGGPDFEGGVRAAGEMLHLPAKERPDGVVILDDLAAEGFTSAVSASSFRPHLVVQTNSLAPRRFSLPAARLEVDTASFACTAVDKLMAAVRLPSLATGQIWFPANLHADAAAED